MTRSIRIALPADTYRLALEPESPEHRSETGPCPDLPRARVPSDAGVLITPAGALTPAAAARAVLSGAGRFHLEEQPGQVFEVNRRGLLSLACRTPLRRLAGGSDRFRAWWLSRTGAPFAWTTPTLDSIRRAIARARDEPAPVRYGEGVVHWIGSLGAGGAERTVLQLVQAQPADVWTARPLRGGDAHYLPQFQSAGARVAHVADLPAGGLEAHWRVVDALGLHPHCAEILQLARALARRRPQALHCWLDDANATGAIAGLLAGVPRIVLSTLNVNPSHFPRLDVPWYRDVYELLATHPRVRLTAMTAVCGEDYAAWAGVDPALFHVVGHGLELERWEPLSSEERAAERARFGIPPDAFVIAGVFRLDAEKRPDDFVDVVAGVREAIPETYALHLGAGPLEEAFRRRIDERGLAGRLLPLGVRSDPRPVVGCADAFLFTSQVEGLGIAALEAQALGLPAVATHAGGLAEAVPDDEALLRPVGDVAGLTAALVGLADPARRAELAARGRAFVSERFAMPAFVARNQALYRTAAP